MNLKNLSQEFVKEYDDKDFDLSFYISNFVSFLEGKIKMESGENYDEVNKELQLLSTMAKEEELYYFDASSHPFLK